jgi:hypothetical protein
MKMLVAVAAVFALAQTAWAQNPDNYRGGWRTDDRDLHIYQFSIRGDVVRGIYCTLCSDATTLAFVDGRLTTEGLTFTVTHVNADGTTAYQDRATARFSSGNVIVSGTSGARGGGKYERVLFKDTRGPDPLAIPVVWIPAPTPAYATLPPLAPRGGGPGRGAAAGGGGAAAIPPAAPRAGGAAPAPAPPPGPSGYQQPGPWRNPLRVDDVVGVWLGFGSGVNKQFFIIRRVGSRLRGMVCGRCDNPYTMAALDDFELQGDTLRFKILHDDWGDWSIPFDKRVIARVAANEMRATTEQDNIPAESRRPGTGGAFSLMGPIAIEATKGNDSRP